MGLLNEAMPRNKAVPMGRMGTEDGEEIKEGSPMGMPNGISKGQGGRCNRRSVFI